MSSTTSTSLVAGAAASDGVVHLGYNHDFSRMGEAAQTDLAAITAIGAALEGTDRPLLIASGTLGLATGRVATEEDDAEPGSHPRIAGAQAALDFAGRGVRSIVARFAPTVHGSSDPGFVAVLVAKARETGVAGYVGDGANRWPAVHRLDAARLVRLAVEAAPAGSVVHATAEEGIPTVQIAEAIGQALGIETASVAPEHFEWLGPFFAADVPASSARTRAFSAGSRRSQGGSGTSLRTSIRVRSSLTAIWHLVTPGGLRRLCTYTRYALESPADSATTIGHAMRTPTSDSQH